MSAAVAKRKRRATHRSSSVFLNVPFDPGYEPLFIALIGSLVALGQRPTCVLEVPGLGAVRRDRLMRHIGSCYLSIHDLSRVQVSRANGLLVPRFNMPLELGIALAVSHYSRNHAVVLLEAIPYRIQYSTSDVNGIDPQIHGGTQRGILECMLNVFGDGADDAREELIAVTRALGRFARDLKRSRRLKHLFHADVFRSLILAATKIVDARQRSITAL